MKNKSINFWKYHKNILVFNMAMEEEYYIEFKIDGYILDPLNVIFNWIIINFWEFQKLMVLK